ncbi:MAG: hypothetical protein MUO54_02465 [Anaerolineales bacterium]|nr:hypothetical protein [Anaerolineales bacterium]
MIKTRNGLSLFLISLVLGLAILACGTGYRTTSTSSGNSGDVRVRMNEADGTDTTSVELNEDFFHERVAVTATLSVESGSCLATLTGDDGTVISLNAAAGSPVEVYGDLVTDGFGEVNLVTDAQGATNVDLFLQFTLK